MRGGDIMSEKEKKELNEQELGDVSGGMVASAYLARYKCRECGYTEQRVEGGGNYAYGGIRKDPVCPKCHRPMIHDYQK